MSILCADCHQPVFGRAIIVDDSVFHRGHLRCSGCKLAIRHYYYPSDSGLPLCATCQASDHPLCAKCNHPVNETFLKANNDSYHLDCYVCTHCQRPFPGGEYVLLGDKPYDMDCYWLQILARQQHLATAS